MDYANIAVAEVLLKLLRNDPCHAMIFYGQLSDQIDNLVSPRNLGGYLANLSIWAHEDGAPMISALVVNQEYLLPGNGFFELYEQLAGKKVKNKEEFFKNELKRVREYDKWEEFAESLGIIDIF